MQRREFITLLGGAAVAWPVVVRAQDKTKRLIGLLAAASPESAMPQTNAIQEGLRDLGYVEGRDYEIVRKWAYGVMSRLPALAEELVQLKPDVIVANADRAMTDTELQDRLSRFLQQDQGEVGRNDAVHMRQD